MQEPLIQLNNLSVGIGAPYTSKIPILRDINLSIASGETLGLVGESGSGKSTVALAMMGYLSEGLSCIEGNVIFEDHSMFELDGQQLENLRGGEICLVPQNAGQSLTPTQTIGRQIQEALMLHTDLPRAQRMAKTIELLGHVRLPQPEEMAKRYPHELSGGQQQRCAIAMALAGEPRALLLDEPTTGLDVTTQIHILELLKELARSHSVAMIFVSHDLGAVARISDRIAVLYSGEVVEVGSREQILSQPEHPYTKALLSSIPRMDGQQSPSALPGYPPGLSAVRDECAFAPRCMHAVEQCFGQASALHHRDQGRQVRCHFTPAHLVSKQDDSKTNQAPKTISDETLLELSDIAISYQSKGLLNRVLGREDSDRVLTVDDICFKLNKGETIGIVGESGSGKSTILRSIVGMMAPCNGAIDFDGVQTLNCLANARSLQCKKDVQMIFQNPDSALNPMQTIAEIIAAPLQLYFGMEIHSARERAAELLESVRLTRDYLDRCPDQLSGGEKQRVGIARAFAAEPKLALCDEVTSALDVSVQAAVLELLENLQKEMGVAYLFVSHDLATVRNVSDRVLVLYQGRICEIGPTSSVYSAPFHPYTEALMAAALEPDPNSNAHIEISDVVESAPPKTGCPFQRRCQYKVGEICNQEKPPGKITSRGSTIYCHLDFD